MQINLGDKVELKGKTYTVVGFKARSVLVELDGKTYKVTPNMIARIQGSPEAKPAQGRQSHVSIEHDEAELARRVAHAQIFDKTARSPVTEDEIMEYLSGLECELSPENLTCDGELGGRQIQARKAAINACWRALERRLGRTVTEDDVYAWYMKRRRQLINNVDKV
jgi:hypothetical protein